MPEDSISEKNPQLPSRVIEVSVKTSSRAIPHIINGLKMAFSNQVEKTTQRHSNNYLSSDAMAWKSGGTWEKKTPHTDIDLRESGERAGLERHQV